MNRHLARLTAIGAAALAVANCAAAPSAETYPNRPIQLVVPYTPGGSTDIFGRSLAKLLGERWKVPVVVDNRGGAGSTIGTDQVVRAPADGYTLLLATSALAINATLMKQLKYRPDRDLAPVAMLAFSPNVLVVTASVKAHSLAELVAQAHANPTRFNYATSGVGTSIHLGMEMFKQMAGVDIPAVHYKGAGPARSDLIAGTVQIMQSNVANAKPFVQSGQLIPLGVTSATRSPLMPDVPTIAESGYPGYEVNTWYGVFAPRGTPPDVVAKLNQAINDVLHRPEVQKQWADSDGAEVVGGTPQSLGDYLTKDMARWKQVIEKGNITVD